MLSLQYDCAEKAGKLYRSGENCEGRLLLIASRGFYNRAVKATVFFTSIERAGLASLFHHTLHPLFSRSGHSTGNFIYIVSIYKMD